MTKKAQTNGSGCFRSIVDVFQIIGAVAGVFGVLIAIVALIYAVRNPERVVEIVRIVSGVTPSPTAATLTPTEPLIPTVAPMPTETPTVTPTPTLAPTPTATFSPTPVVVISSSFDEIDIGGWTAIYSTITNPGIGGNTTGSDNDGHLRAQNRGDNLLAYYIAPPAYHGDWRQFSELMVDLWSSGGRSSAGSDRAIHLANGPLQVERSFPHRPGETWETFIIPLKDDGLWIFGPGTMRLEDVLANVTEFRVRAEYGNGDDLSGLDNVVLIIKQP